MRLELLAELYAVARLDPAADVPQWTSGEFVSITRTREELSVVCAEWCVPPDVRCERGWRCFSVAGPIPFETTGIAASLVGPLADANISVFLVSTYDTDYLLVKESALGRASEALRRAGHSL